MHSNLTAADVAKYFGCPIIDDDGRVFTHYCLYVNGEIRVAFGDISSEIDQCHLLLKPLSELSDEDAVEVAKLANFNRVEVQIAIGKDIANSISNKIVDRLSYTPYTNIIDCIGYLRSKRYDMDGFLTTNKAKHG